MPGARSSRCPDAFYGTLCTGYRAPHPGRARHSFVHAPAARAPQHLRDSGLLPPRDRGAERPRFGGLPGGLDRIHRPPSVRPWFCDARVDIRDGRPEVESSSTGPMPLSPRFVICRVVGRRNPGCAPSSASFPASGPPAPPLPGNALLSWPWALPSFLPPT